MNLTDRITKAKKQPNTTPYFNALANQVGMLSVTGNFPLFMQGMMGEIRTYLTRAFYNGLSECGIAPEEATVNEVNTLNQMVENELQYLVRLGNDVIVSRNEGQSIRAMYPRVELWTNRYMDVYNRARAMACGDQKLEWIVGPTEQHCSSCTTLNGKVKRASQWQEGGILPQNPPNRKLECGGWRCLCQLEQTNKPLSAGPLPYLNKQYTETIETSRDAQCPAMAHWQVKYWDGVYVCNVHAASFTMSELIPLAKNMQSSVQCCRIFGEIKL